MRRMLFVAALGVGVVALASSSALALAPETVIADVPFAFHVGSRALPAGEYRIQPLSEDQQVLEIRSADGRRAALILIDSTRTENPDARPELVFDRYGKQRYLHAVELPEGMDVLLKSSRSEVQAARAFAARQPSPAARTRS